MRKATFDRTDGYWLVEDDGQRFKCGASHLRTLCPVELYDHAGRFLTLAGVGYVVDDIDAIMQVKRNEKGF